MNMRRIMLIGLVGPVLLSMLVVAEHVVAKHGNQEWWRQVALIVGVGYLIPVFGTLAGWKLVAAVQRFGRYAVFYVRSVIGGLLMGSCILASIGLREPIPKLSTKLREFFFDFRTILVLLIIGIIYALIPYVRHTKSAKPDK